MLAARWVTVYEPRGVPTGWASPQQLPFCVLTSLLSNLNELVPEMYGYLSMSIDELELG